MMKTKQKHFVIGSVEELYNEIEKAVATGFMTENPYKGFPSWKHGGNQLRFS